MSSPSSRCFFLGLSLLLFFTPSVALGVDYGATTSGFWNSSSTWTNSTVPGVNDNAYIGSSYPTGAALQPTVTLNGNVTVYDVFLGYNLGSGTVTTGPTLALGNFNLTCQNLTLGSGWNAPWSLIEGASGSLTVQNILTLDYGSFTFHSADSVLSINLYGGPTAATAACTTSATGNITGSVLLQQSGAAVSPTLTLRANLSVSGDIRIDQGTVNAQSLYSLTAANDIYLGWYSSTPGTGTITNRTGTNAGGAVITPNLFVNGLAFNLTKFDSVSIFNLENGSTVFPTTASVVSINLYGGPTSAAAAATTSATGNITGSVYLQQNGATVSPTLTLGANLSVAGDIRIDQGTIDAQSLYSLSAANNIFLGWYSSTPGTGTITNRTGTNAGGAVITPNLFVNGLAFNLTKFDSVGIFNLENGSTVFPTTASVVSINLYGGPTSAAAAATTSATGNITGSVLLQQQGFATAPTLTLGANLSVAGDIRIDQGTIDAKSLYSLSAANDIFLGWYSNTPGTGTISNRTGTNAGGAVNTPNLYVNGLAFNLTQFDSVTNFYLANGSTAFPTLSSVQNLTLYGGPTAATATASTSAIGNITSNVLLQQSGAATAPTLTLGANLSVSGDLRIDQGTIDAKSLYSLTAANDIFLGWYSNIPGTGTIANRTGTNAGGAVITPNLYVNGLAFNLSQFDSVTNFYLANGSTAFPSLASVQNFTLYGGPTTTTAAGATSAIGNITANVFLSNSGSAAITPTLTLGANLSVSGDIRIDEGTIDAKSLYSLTATNDIYLGWYSSTPGTASIANRTGTNVGGAVITPNLYVNGLAFNLSQFDSVNTFNLANGSTAFSALASVQNFNLYGGPTTATAAGATSAIGNITANVFLSNSGSAAITPTLTLGANLSVTGDVRVDAGTINAQGHAITSTNLYLGSYSNQAVTLQNPGAVQVTNMYVSGGTSVSLTSGADSVGNVLSITNSSTVTATSSITGIRYGLTLNGSFLSDLSIDATSHLDLVFPDTLGGSPFRWLNPSSSTNHINDIKNLIAGGEISISEPSGVVYSIVTRSDGYTYVTFSATVKWTGSVSNAWDINTTHNWTGASSTYLQATGAGGSGEIVVFDDTATGNYSVDLTTALSPNSLTVNNSSHTYTFSGTGKITGAIPLLKSGTGTLIISTVNDYTGGTTISGGTISVANDNALGASSSAVSIGVFGTLLYTGSTTTSRTFEASGNSIGGTINPGTNTITLNGATVGSVYVTGPGQTVPGSGTNTGIPQPKAGGFTTGILGATFNGTIAQPNAVILSNSSLDMFTNFNNGGYLGLAVNLNSASTSNPTPGPVNFISLTVQGSGAVVVGQNTTINVNGLSTNGFLELIPDTAGAYGHQGGKLVNSGPTGSSELEFKAGSVTRIGTPTDDVLQTTTVDLHGNNLRVIGGLFVNNGYVADYTVGNGSGPGVVIADSDSIVKGGGTYYNSPQTANTLGAPHKPGLVLPGNSIGKVTYVNATFGPGGASNMAFQISDVNGPSGGALSGSATGTPTSGYGLFNVSQSLTWTATSTNKVTIQLQSLLNNDVVGGPGNAGPVYNFNSHQSYSWPMIKWTTGYLSSNPQTSQALNATVNVDSATAFANVNPLNGGTFSVSLSGNTEGTGPGEIDIVFTPAATPEPVAVLGLAAVGLGLARVVRRRHFA